MQQSLSELLQALGTSDFELDYIRLEAERRSGFRPRQNAGPAQEFQDRLHQLQQEHDHRMNVIRSLPTLSEDIREQLLEAEESRFQQQLFGRDGL